MNLRNVADRPVEHLSFVKRAASVPSSGSSATVVNKGTIVDFEAKIGNLTAFVSEAVADMETLKQEKSLTNGVPRLDFVEMRCHLSSRMENEMRVAVRPGRASQKHELCCRHALCQVLPVY